MEALAWSPRAPELLKGQELGGSKIRRSLTVGASGEGSGRPQ